MASSSYFQNSDDEENPFISKDNTSRATKNNNINTRNINNLNSNINTNANKNKRYISNDISMESDSSSTLNQDTHDRSYYHNPNNRKRLKVNGQNSNDTIYYEKENTRNEK